MSTSNTTTINADIIHEVNIGSATPSPSTIQQTQNEAETVEDVTVIEALEKQNSAIPYDTMYERKGQPHVLIICNFEYDLPGYANDVESLEKMWKEFGCKVSVKKDLPVDKMKSAILEFADVTLSGKESYIPVFVLSHGCRGGYIHGADGKKLHVKEILEQFTNKKTKLQQIPKLFFFQMCRGKKADPGHSMKLNPKDGNSKTAFVKKSPALKIPQVSDALIAYGAQKGKAAIVETTGSWFIQSIVETFNEYAETEHVVDMLTLVNEKMADQVASNDKDDEIDGAKAMSEFTSTFRKKLYIRYNASK